jgi:hypothetical protein
VAALLAHVLDELLDLEFLEVAADGIGGDAETLGKFSRRKGLGALQLDEDVAPESAVASQARRDGGHE